MRKFTNILVHVDSRADNTPTLERVAELAQKDSAPIKLVDIVPDFDWLVRLFAGGTERAVEQLTQDKSRGLEALAEGLRQRGLEVTTKLLNGPTSVQLIREVLQEGHDLVIKMAKGKDSPRGGFFGTTATRLFRKCPCPVLILKPGHSGRCEQIVAAVEATPSDAEHASLDRRILELAQHLQHLDQAALDVVHVWSLFGASVLKEHMRREEYDELVHHTEAENERHLDNLLLQFGMGVGNPNVHLLAGSAGTRIPELVAEKSADLLVVGTVGRWGLTGVLIGNTAEQILDRVECSILALKPDGFVSPIR